MYDVTKGAGLSGFIDLRSDTVTQPSRAMREAMAHASVGDDVYGDDPTVLQLETMVADLLGKEAALFVTSGTQSNLIALLSHCGRGEEYIGGVGTHIAKYEAGGAAVLGGISPRHLPLQDNGCMAAADVAAAVQPDDPHFAITRLVCLENTFNGRVVPQAAIEAVADVADDHGLALHLDGARLMNAVVATGRTARDLTERMDSVSLCLSKGLGAPVGSVLAGPADFIARARRNRKLLGGGLRQSGVLAACGLYALQHNVERLGEDHAHARTLGERLAGLDGIALAQPVDTNMVWLTVETANRAPISRFMAERGIVVAQPDRNNGLRLVTHLDVGEQDVETVVSAFEAWCGAA